MPTRSVNDFTTSWDINPSASTPQDGHDHCSEGFLKHFGISDVLMPYEDCRFNEYACVEVPQHFGDEAYKVINAVGETRYDNWKIDDYFPLDYDVGFSLF